MISKKRLRRVFGAVATAVLMSAVVTANVHAQESSAAQEPSTSGSTNITMILKDII